MKKILIPLFLLSLWLAACTHEIIPGQIADGPRPVDRNAIVQGRITLKEGMTANSSATLFIIARSRDNPVGPPLAVRAVGNPVFPLEFEMSQENVMGIGGRRFAGALILRVRLDQDGNAMTVSAGDVMSTGEVNATVGDRDIKIELDKVAAESD